MPGFLPGTEQESIGVVRHGANLLHAFAEATVPRYTVVLREALGGAYVTMDSKEIGADLTFAWSWTELGIRAPTRAVGIVHRRAVEQRTTGPRRASAWPTTAPRAISARTSPPPRAT
jgi:acetyl-CoA carboxylase carboxyltransferase component